MFRRPFAAFLAVLILIPVLAIAGDDPESGPDLKERLLEHRRALAEGKAAAMAKAHAVKAIPPTANQGLYDVRHYLLDLDLNPTSNWLTGEVTVTAEVVGASMMTMDLDLKSNLTVTQAWSDGLATTNSRYTNLVTVDLDRTYTTGETVVVKVAYAGNPEGGAFGWSSHAGLDMIWTLSEPFGAREWWPCKDLNTDKADSLDVVVTVPDNLVVASQGLLVSETSGGGDATFHWKSTYPINTYLVSLAVYPYHRYSDWYTPLAGGDDMEVQFFIYPDHIGSVEPNYALTVPMIGAFAQAYGEYPFVEEKYGHAEFTWGGGMEHQTISSMGGWSEDLISHELAHQWWGDMVTCADFGHIWLNEGFATWSEAYWKETTDGVATYQQYMDAAAYYGPGTVFVEDTSDFGSIFDSNLSYNKGSWIVHMLRGVLGDTDFFSSLDLYRATYEYGTATTEDLQAIMETVSGLDLTAFIQQWIYGEYFPVYSMGWTAGPGAGEITVTIDQVQETTGVFTMPIRLRVTTDLGVEDVTVQNDQLSQQFVIPITGTAQTVQLDPDRWILRQVETIVTNPTYDAGILLVNGVDWNTYSTEITSAYDDSTFAGFQDFDFWDTFAEPAGGYPAALPAPLGHGNVQAEVLGEYSTVIWVGNNYNGDLAKWAETPIASYLETGGNVLLLARRAKSFVEGDLTDYLGVTWAEGDATLSNCTFQYPGLTSMNFLGTQSWNDVFYTTTYPYATLLFADTSGFSAIRGVGVWSDPPGDGTYRSEGGQFVLISGRPYRYDHIAMRQNVDFILTNMLGEPYTSVSAVPDPGPLPVAKTALLGNHPNPFNPRTSVAFELASPGEVRLAVYDLGGRLVRTLVDGRVMTAGRHEAAWDGRDNSGRTVAAGVYVARMVAGDTARSLRMTLVK